MICSKTTFCQWTKREISFGNGDKNRNGSAWGIRTPDLRLERAVS